MSSSLHFHRSSEEPDTASLIREMMQLDRELYGEVGAEHLGTFEYWLERFARCPASLSIARHGGGRLAGYYQFLPVTAAYRDLVLQGQARDGEIPVDAIVPYCQPPQPYHLHLCSMAVRPEFRRHGVASRLYREEVEFQHRQRRLGFVPQSLVSVVWSDCGGRFFERLKLPRVGRDAWNHPIHFMELPDGVLPELPSSTAALQPPLPIAA